MKLKQIEDVVCEVFNVDDFKIKSRKRDIVDARKAYSYFGRLHTDKTYDRIGEYINQPHDVILYHEKKFIELLNYDANLKRKKELCEFMFAELENKSELNLV